MAKSKQKTDIVTKKKFLNVGGGPSQTLIPAQYNDWEHLLLDIDPSVNPDIVCDARELSSRPAGEFDAVYCSHNLEHYFRHDGLKVLQGFLHVLKDDGFAHIRVPDIQEVMRHIVENNKDISDVLYQSALGPITARDVIYGYEEQIAQSGQDYYAHKTGFSPQSLKLFLHQAGFPMVGIGENKAAFEIVAVGFKNEPSEDAKKIFNL